MPGGFTTGQEVGPPDPEQRQVSGQSAASTTTATCDL
jgi:hypothetical protein